MAQRIIRDGILDSEKINRVSFLAELFFRRLMSVVDDYGRYDGRITILRSSCYPTKVDYIENNDIALWLEDCCREGLIIKYEIGGKPYIQIENFGQRLRQMRQKYPAPPKIGNKETEDNHMQTTCGQPADNLRTIDSNLRTTCGQPADNSSPEVEVEVEVESEEEVERESYAQAREEKPTPNFPSKEISLSNSITELNNTPPDSAQPPSISDRKLPATSRNGKPLIRDDDLIAEILKDPNFKEMFMHCSNVRTLEHMTETAEKYILNERRKRDEDFVMMTRQEAMNGLLLWLKNEKPKSEKTMKSNGEKKIFSFQDREEDKFRKAVEYQRKRNPGW